MSIDLSMLAKSIGTLNDLDPARDLPATLHQAVLTAKQLFDAQAAGIMLTDADGKLRWASASDQRAQTLEDNQEIFAAGPCMQAFTSGKPAVMHDATLERRWGEIALTFVEVQIRSGLSVPVELGGGGGVPAGGVAGGAVDGSEGLPNDTPGAPGSKLTLGTPSSPRSASSTSKNSSGSKWNMLAITFDGTDWTRRLYSRTFAL